MRASGDIDGDESGIECEKRAVGLLARREHSRFELERKLLARGFDAAIVAETLNRLEQKGFLSGQHFMTTFIASRAARGSGPEKIRAELVQRGIRPDDAARALRDADEDWVAIARKARIKRFGAASPGSFEEKARQMRFLMARGFTKEQIDAALEVDADSD